MKERKLKEDWRLEQRIAENGKEERVPVYTGTYYMLSAEKKRRLFVPVLICFLAFILSGLAFLLLGRAGTYCMYVLPVFLCGLIPAAYWAMGLAGMMTSPAKMTSVQKEKGICRAFRSALGCAVLSGMAAVGDAVLILRAAPVGEWVDTVLLAVCCAFSSAAFLRLRPVCAGMDGKGGVPS